MARFLRSYGIYRVYPPAVVEPTLLGSDSRLRIKTLLAGRTRRLEQQRRFPLQGSAGQPVRESSRQSGNAEPLGTYYRLLGPRPPQIVNPGPTLEQQKPTVVLRAVSTRPERLRRAPKSRLAPPAVVSTPTVFIAAPIQTHLVGIRTRPRAVHSKLSAPTALRVFSGPSVTDAAVRARIERAHRRSFSALGSPVIVAPPIAFSGAKVTEVRTRPRAVHSKLSPPTVITAAAAEPLARPIQTSIAVERRVGRAQRLPFWRLSYPVLVEAALQPPDRRLEVLTVFAPQDRQLRRRRRTTSVLGGPVVIASAPVVTKIQTKLVAIATRIVEVRRAKSKLPGPATLAPPPAPVKTTPTVVLVATKTRADYRRRDVAAVLRKPTVVSTPVAPVVTTIRVKCVPVTHRRRATRFTLRLPATLTADPCRPVLEAIATTDFTPSAITPDSLSPTPLAADPLSLTPLAGDPLSLTPLTPDDLGAPDDPC